jgi:hypothetical protein
MANIQENRFGTLGRQVARWLAEQRLRERLAATAGRVGRDCLHKAAPWSAPEHPDWVRPPFTGTPEEFTVYDRRMTTLTGLALFFGALNLVSVFFADSGLEIFIGVTAGALLLTGAWVITALRRQLC